MFKTTVLPDIVSYSECNNKTLLNSHIVHACSYGELQIPDYALRGAII